MNCTFEWDNYIIIDMGLASSLFDKTLVKWLNFDKQIIDYIENDNKMKTVPNWGQNELLVFAEK